MLSIQSPFIKVPYCSVYMVFRQKSKASFRTVIIKMINFISNIFKKYRTFSYSYECYELVADEKKKKKKHKQNVCLCITYLVIVHTCYVLSSSVILFNDLIVTEL